MPRSKCKEGYVSMPELDGMIQKAGGHNCILMTWAPMMGAEPSAMMA